MLTSALIMLFCDRHFGTHIFSVQGGGSPILWQNLFWFFGHPEVYILALPYFGIVTEVIPVFSRKPVFGYKGMVFATLSIAALSTGVWAHHMFTTGVVLLPFFSLLSPAHRRADRDQVLQLDRDDVAGPDPLLEPPMLFSIGFLFAFLMGGVTGVMLASPPIDFFTHDTYFVVAHFHQVLFGTAVFAGFAGLYYWYPKFFGRMLGENLGKWHFWLMFIGFWVTFMPQYVVGLLGHAATGGHLPVQPRLAELQHHLDRRGVRHRHLVRGPARGTCGSPGGDPVPSGDNPWDAHTLEWFTTSPPPHHNYSHLPPIRSERPTWDYNHPDAPAIGHGEGHEAGGDKEKVLASS